MVPSDEFQRHATECEYMARFARDPESKKVWRSMAERWVRCAKLAERHEPVSRMMIHRSERIAPGA